MIKMFTAGIIINLNSLTIVNIEKEQKLLRNLTCLKF